MTPLDWPRLFSLASHELRTPAGVSAGYVRMLLAGRPHPPTDEQRRLLDAADRASARVARLLAEMSDLARLASGEATLQPSRFVLDEVVAAATDAFTPREASGIEVAIRPAPSPLAVLADRERVLAGVSAVLAAVGRECPDGAVLVASLSTLDDGPTRHAALVVSEASSVDRAVAADRAWGPGDVFRSGNGLALVVAALAVEASGGRIDSPTGDRTPALRLTLPLAG